MKLNVLEDNTVQLKEVYNSIVLTTNSDEELVICMRDTGFEFKYQNQWYSAQQGVITKIDFK